MKDLYVIDHQRGEDPILYYASLQNDIGDVLAETMDFTIEETSKAFVDSMVAMLRECAEGKRSASPYYCGGWYYYTLVEGPMIMLRTRAEATQAEADAVLMELLECVQGKVIRYSHLKEKEVLTLDVDPKVLSYMNSLDGQGTNNLLNYTTDVQWENPNSWLWDPELGQMRNIYYKLFHRMPRIRGAQYTVTVRTGFEENAGTDANVYLTLYGKRTDVTGAVTMTQSKEFRLAGSKQDFDDMSIDVFELSVEEDLGILEKVRIRHDNTTQGDCNASWYLMDVTVEKTGTSLKWVFPCNKWLQVTGNEKTNDVTLTSTENYHRDIYYVEIHPNENVFAEGEDSGIYITLCSKNSTSKEYKLDTTLRKLQEKDVGLKFYVYNNVGHLEKIELRLDNPKACPEWNLGSVMVENITQGGRWYFPFGRVVPSDDVDEKEGLRHMLVAGPTEEGETIYAVRVRTGSAFNSSTAARVHITLHGTRSSSQEYKLDSPINDFQRGNLDTFRISVKEDLGDLQEIRIRHDNFGLWPDWYLEWVKIEKVGEADAWKFPCGRWLAKRREDGKIDRTLPALLPGQEACKYNISVRTGDVKGAATFADVRISLYGEKGALEDFELNGFGFDFLRDWRSDFSIDLARDLGELKSIRIRQDGSGLMHEWYLEDITVTRTGGAGEERSWYFLCEDWLDNKNGLERTLEAVAGRTGPLFYQVQLRTGDLKRAGTNANVYITLNGTNGSSRECCLNKIGDDFERGATDDFSIRQASDLGELLSVRIRQDGSGLMDGWYLEDVRIALQGTDRSWYFPCGQWLAKGEDDGQRERILEAVPEEKTEGGNEA